MPATNYLTTRQAARLLGVSVPTAQNWAERGLLASWKTDGGHRRILHASVLARLQEQAGAPPPELPVLVVEDDASLLRLYRHQLQTWPFPVRMHVAANGYEGLVLAGEVRPAMMVCDLRLPGVNGFNIVRALCAMPRFQDLVIVVVSGLPQAEISAHGGLPERVVVMGKPVDFARLRDLAAPLWERLREAAQSSPPR